MVFYYSNGFIIKLLIHQQKRFLAYMDYVANLDSLGYRPANLDFAQLPYITPNSSGFHLTTSSPDLLPWISHYHLELLPAYLDNLIYLPSCRI